jgi:hypothetical protein
LRLPQQRRLRAEFSALIELGARYLACRAIRFQASAARQYLSDIRGEHA